MGDLFYILFEGRVFALYFVWKVDGGSKRKGFDKAMMFSEFLPGL